METIVDGYNLIFAWGWLVESGHSQDLKKSRERLIRELSRRIPQPLRHKVTIVFDAKNRSALNSGSDLPSHGFQVLFAHGHDDADTLIEELIRRHANPATLTVVSSDQRLKIAAQRRAAQAIDSADWLDQLDGLQQVDSTINPSEIPLSTKQSAIEQLSQIDWLAEFQIEDPLALNAGSTIDDGGSTNDDGGSTNKTDDQDHVEHFNPFPPGYGEDLLS